MEKSAELPSRETAAWQRSRILLAMAVGILPLVALVAANVWRQVQDGEQRVTEDRVALARAAALTVNGFVDTSFAALQTLAVTRTVADPTPRAELNELFDRARGSNSPLAVVSLFRPDGWNVVQAGPNQPPLTVNVLDRRYVQEARATGRRVVSPAMIPRSTGILTVDLVIPIDFARGGRGVLLGSLALTRLGDELRALPGSDSVQIVLVDADGQVILHPDPNVVRSVTSLRGRPEVEAALQAQTGSRRGTGQDGSEDLIAYAPVSDYGWGVLVVQPVSTAFALVRRDALLAVAGLCVILALATIMAWLLGGRLESAYRELFRAKTQAEGARTLAEHAQKRLAFLAEASQILGSSVEDWTTLERVTQLAVPILGDSCAIDLVESASVNGHTAGALEPTHELRTQLSDQAIAEGRLVKSEQARATGPSGFAVPLVASGRVLGAITCLRSDAHQYEEDDLSLATELAQRLALAVDNLALYQTAQRAIRDRDEFMSVAAHELKTPITSLRGYAQLAINRIDKHELAATDGLRKALEVIEVQSGKLTHLVGQLLDVSRLEAGKLTLVREQIDLVPIISSLVERTQMMSDRHTLVVNTPPTVMANVDVLRIEQVMTNLLDNAIKFSPEGGQVRVVVDNADDESVSLVIEDDGVGIPTERRDHIFERYYQAHGRLLRSAMNGMGLGLFISRQIVQLHGGIIEAQFPHAGGARFVIRLPLNNEAEVLSI